MKCKHKWVVVVVRTALVFKVTEYRCSKCGRVKIVKEA